MIHDPSDTRSLRRARKAAQLAEAERLGVVLSLMSSPAGRNYVWDFLSRCHIFTTTFTPSPYSAAFNEGARNIGLQLLAEINLAAPDQYVQMIREANDRHIAANRGPLGDRTDDGRDDSRRPDDADGSVLHEYDPGLDEVGHDAADGGAEGG